MSRLRPTLEFRRGDELVAHVVASADAIWFRGHFPAWPILPGVALLAVVEAAIASLWPDSDHPAVEIMGFHRIRFRRVIEPGANLRIRIRRPEVGRLRFTVEAAGLAVVSGECLTTDACRAVSRPDTLLPLADAHISRPFCSDGTTLADIAGRARSLCELRSGDGPATICVASEDRADVAAAALAAFSGGAMVLFPPALTVEAVLATHRLRNFSHWLGPKDWASQVPADLIEGGIEQATGTKLPWTGGSSARQVPCIFLHTGGTTGTPSSWAKTASNLLDEVMLHVRSLQADAEDHILATVPPHHIYGLLFSVLLPLASGATVERRSPFFPQEVAERIARTSATILVSTPAHLKALAQVMTGPHRLRLVLSSGAPLSAADSQGFFDRTGLWPLEVYGSTETGGIALRRQDVPDAPWRPLPSIACRIDGEVLAVRSTFTSDDVSLDSEGFFRTADLAALRSDGSFDLGGRADGVVKVGGVRVLLPEVERAILALGQVQDAVVLALPSDSGRGQDIVALVASSRPADEILRALRETLPSPSWPRRLRAVDAIPTTPSGKRDRSLILQLLDETGVG